jgi:hypothetical protein
MLLSTSNVMIGDVITTRDGHETKVVGKQGNFFLTTDCGKIHFGNVMSLLRNEKYLMIDHSPEDIELMLSESPKDEYPKAHWQIEREKKLSKGETDDDTDL